MFYFGRDVVYCLRQSWVSGSEAAISNEEIRGQIHYSHLYKYYFIDTQCVLISSSLVGKITDFRVLNSEDTSSDHFPIEACIYFDYSVIHKTQRKKHNY
ncbi:hypothetical protein BpHYR1_003099 [Brachionus plicatilis]|uniref:Uncharacterized protein n=1 Tax=Brachionus plicatilis TaxID=10195 RepID=A0A3M7SJ02_BRAPC|nr:hypothetical protein BpHYR1_003099 [Brachionus plicatilis]